MYGFQPENTSAPEQLRSAIGLTPRSRVSSMRRVCAFGIAMALVVVTLVLPSYAGHDSTWTVGISSVTWKKPAKDRKLNLMSPILSREENISIVILFKGFQPPPSQESIDALYRALTPPVELERVFDFTSPAQAGEALRRDEIDPANSESLVRSMGRDLPVSRVLVVRLLAKGDHVTVQCNLREAKTGKTIGRQSEESVLKEHLAEKLRTMAHSLLSDSRRSERG